MISDINELLQQELEYTLQKPDCHSWWISKMHSGREDTLEERYTIKLCFKLGKKATEMYGMLQTAFGGSWMDRVSVFEWHKRFKEGTESVRDDERCGRSKESIHQNWLAKGLGLGSLCWGFKGVQEEIPRPALFKLGQWHFHQDNTPVHNSILVTDYLAKMGIKTVPQPPFSPDLAPSDFWLFPKLRSCRYETTEEMKEAGTKKMSGNLFNDPRKSENCLRIICRSFVFWVQQKGGSEFLNIFKWTLFWILMINILLFFFLLLNYKNHFTLLTFLFMKILAQSAGVVEHTNSISAGLRPSLLNKCPGDDNKQYDGGVPVIQELWWIPRTRSLPSR